MTKTAQLKPESLPLTGCHLIEASAGTGKTYNITRIYLRLLLERKLDVKNILVMTFTRAATEELRARIAKEIRNALDHWGEFAENDRFFAALTEIYTIDEVYPALHNALLHLDEAAIFTIHGFCKRVLSQQAFASGIDFNLQMEVDTAAIELEAVRDWYRTLAKQEKEAEYRLLTQKWAAPEDFHQAFRELLSSTISVEMNTAESVKEHFIEQKNIALMALQAEQDFVFEQLIDPHKQADSRSEEWQVLLQWLADNELQSMPKEATGVFNGSRYSRKPVEIKQHLAALFEPLKQLKTQAEAIDSELEKAQAYEIAVQGIDTIRKKITQAKQRSRVMNYDDLIHQLAAAIGKEGNLAQLIQEQYPVALVDEFQDTDAQQYAILKAIYQNSVDKNSALYMIGDPKQAIYAFRSGDVFTYLAARGDADQQWLMDTNWRSSSNMITAYNRLFYGAPLKDTAQDVFAFDIQYSPVKAAGKADKTPLGSQDAALQFIYFPYNEEYRYKYSKELMNQDFCPLIAQWCSAEIHCLLTENTTIGESALREQDIAILVRDKKEAAVMQDALRMAGYPSVYLSSHDNVFLSSEAVELQQVLKGILELENERLLIAALSTRYLACDALQLQALKEDESQWESYREQVFELRDIWLKRGFMAMALKLLHHSFMPQPQHHERSLTNAIQLLELLQQASQQHSQPEQLLHWLAEQINSNKAPAEAELRLESDADLIRIITQHGCKGLEYPVVFIPFATRHKDPAKFGNKTLDLFKYHNRDSQHLHYFVGQDKRIIDLYKEEAYAESIRLLYVAITRAEHRCYLGVAPFYGFHLSSLGQTLKCSAESDLQQSLIDIAASEPDSIAVRHIEALDFPVIRNAAAIAEQNYSPAIFSGRIERNWWLSSFSALTRNLRHGGISSPDRDELLNVVESAAPAAEQIRFTLTKGVAAGNLLHDILQYCDFSQPHWQASMERPLSRFNESLDETQCNDLSDWLQACLDSHLAQNGPRLSDLLWADTLRESEFYFPMEQLKSGALGKVLASHRQQRNNNAEIESISLEADKGVLQGMMHGFIDLVFQWQDKYYVVDYKSTHLGDQLGDYGHSALDQNIRDNYYDLQYLLYSLALHRYLKNRRTDYDPQEHFGGVYYLYLRGMSPGLDSGIFNTDISPQLLAELDALFSNTISEESAYV